MAKTSRSGPKPQNRRGSPEAIEKRRAARLFNDVLGGGGTGRPKPDGRTEKRRVPPESIVDVVGRLHKAYAFRPECYRFVGVGDDVLRSAGVLTGDLPRQGRMRERAA